MIIRTTQELADVDCCGCLPLECDTFKKECESITLALSCGHILPEIEGVEMTPADACRRFATKTSVYLEDYSTAFPDYFQTTEYTRTYTHTLSKEIDSEGVCQETFTKTESSHDESIVLLSAGGRKWPEVITDWSSSSSSSSACSGTVTTQTTYESDPADPADTDTSTSDYDYCFATEIFPDASYTKTGFVYTKTITDPEPPDSAPVGHYIQTWTVTFAGENTPEEAVAQMAAKSFPDDANGTLCDSKMVMCEESVSSITKARYRLGVPDSYLPPNPTRSTYEMQWDEAFFPDGYDATIDDPGVTPPVDPPEGYTPPQIPDPAAPAPSIVASRSWEWDGDTENPWSGWFEIAVPEEPGETRVINAMVKCHKSTRLGVKPTAHGESYEIPAP